MIGLSDLPLCKAKYTEIGAAVVETQKGRPRALGGGGGSYRRDCHCADIPSPSMLKIERGVQQTDSLADG